MKNNIYQIEVTKHKSVSIFYTKNMVCPGDPKKRQIGEIKDHSVEWEDGIHTSYCISDKKGEMIACIENVPVIINYV